MNKILKSSQTLYDILSHQRCRLDKSSLGYVGELSNKNDAKPNASNKKDVKKHGRNIDAPSSSKSKEKSQDDIGRYPTPRRSVDGVKYARVNRYHQRIPGQIDFKSKSRKSPSPKYQIIFFGYCYSFTNFRHMENDCRAYHKDKYNGPHQSPRSNFARRIHSSSFMNKME